MGNGTEEYILDTKDGKRFQIILVHSDFNTLIFKIRNPQNGDLYDDLDEIETDMIKLVGASYIICVDATGDSVIVPEKIIAESLISITEIK